MIIISLGYDCTVTKQLEGMGLRQQDSPFDWWASPRFSDVLSVMERILNGQEIGLDPPHLSSIPGNHLMTGTLIRTNHYVGVDNFAETMNRRCKRFEENIRSSENVLFVREQECDDSPPDLELFKKLIETFNPALNYSLLILYSNGFTPCKLSRVFEYPFDGGSKMGEYIKRLESDASHWGDSP